MQPFHTLEHTADVGFEAFGATREQAFANAARALTDLMAAPESILPREELSLQTEGSDVPSLLVNWLSEILYLFDAEGWLFHDFDIQNLTGNSLTATARGEKFDRTRHQPRLMVKAITYHQLEFKETTQGWRAQVYVDV